MDTCLIFSTTGANEHAYRIISFTETFYLLDINCVVACLYEGFAVQCEFMIVIGTSNEPKCGMNASACIVLSKSKNSSLKYLDGKCQNKYAHLCLFVHVASSRSRRIEFSTTANILGGLIWPWGILVYVVEQVLVTGLPSPSGEGTIGIGLDSCVMHTRHTGIYLVQTTDLYPHHSQTIL